MNEVGKKNDWQVTTGSNPYNVDTLGRKGLSVYKTFQQMGQDVCAPELVAEVFLNVELRLSCDRLKIIDHACDSTSGSKQYSIADFRIKI